MISTTKYYILAVFYIICNHFLFYTESVRPVSELQYFVLVYVNLQPFPFVSVQRLQKSVVCSNSLKHI